MLRGSSACNLKTHAKCRFHWPCCRAELCASPPKNKEDAVYADMVLLL